MIFLVACQVQVAYAWVEMTKDFKQMSNFISEITHAK